MFWDLSTVDIRKLKNISGYNIIGNDEWLLNYKDEINVIIGIGNSEVRAKV